MKIELINTLSCELSDVSPLGREEVRKVTEDVGGLRKEAEEGSFVYPTSFIPKNFSDFRRFAHGRQLKGFIMIFFN